MFFVFKVSTLRLGLFFLSVGVLILSVVVMVYLHSLYQKRKEKILHYFEIGKYNDLKQKKQKSKDLGNEYIAEGVSILLNSVAIFLNANVSHELNYYTFQKVLISLGIIFLIVSIYFIGRGIWWRLRI